MIPGASDLTLVGGVANGDPYFSSVVLLMHMDGANNGTTFSDVTGKTITRFGNPVTKTATKQFGTASSYFDGTADQLRVPYSTDFDFGASDWTIETWLYPVANPASSTYLITRRDDAQGGTHPLFVIYRTPAGLVGILQTAASSSDITYIRSVASAPLNQWTHLAFVRLAGSASIYVNGTLSQTVTTNLNTAYPTWTDSLCIGGDYDLSPGYDLNGYMDDLRITKGVARYTSNFTPPTTSHPDF